MPLAAEFDSIDVLWIALSAFLVLVGLALAYVLLRLAGAVARATTFLRGLETEVLPLLHKAGGTVDRVNAQLDKVDRVTDSAVDAADSLDSAVRAVSHAVTKPVQKISGLFEGLAHGAASLRTRRGFRSAVDTGRQAASRREQDLEEELERGGDGR